MSYDLQVWSSARPALPGSLPQAGDWQLNGETWYHRRRAWQVCLSPASRVLPEDVPEPVSLTLPGVAWLTELNLAPFDAAAPARRFLDRAALAIAKAAHGVVVDPQTDTLTTPKGVKRWVSPGADEAATVLNLSWWFAEGPLADGTGFGELVDVLGRVLPDALPRRYGLYEPPQHVYATTGRDHFLDFLATHARGIGTVWYARAPIANLNLGLPDRIGGSPKGFRSGHLEIEVDKEALRQPGWPLALSEAWRRIGQVVRPFYGDVRTLGGYRRSRGRYWGGFATQQHPVCSWWWEGIPLGPAHAVVVGEPYLSLWPAFAKVAEREHGLAHVSTGDWLTDEDALRHVGAPPAGIAQVTPEHRALRSPPTYPPVWPFEEPRTTGPG